MAKKDIEGVCPNCGSEDIDYVQSDEGFDNSTGEHWFAYLCECLECETEFYQEYTMTYKYSYLAD